MVAQKNQCPWRAHPRVSGENLSAFALMRPIIGSSPRERGKPVGLLASPARIRLIPA